MPDTFTTHPEDWIRETIEAFVRTSPVNTLGPTMAEPAFDTPLVGFSAGDDPIYDEYVAHIGDFYLTPAGIFNRAFGQASPAPAVELSVISWILPSTTATRMDQSAEERRPAERWVRTRHFGEQFNETLRHHVVASLTSRGVAAVAPVPSPFWERSDQGAFAPCSNWSERHAAFSAGLGTFGLCDGLITPVGKAIRAGSVVARIKLTPTPRPYTDRHAYCLYYSHGTCGKCVPRCPVNALGADGHDKQRCMRYTEHAMNSFVQKAYGIDTYACGLCQCAVPCMDHIPDPGEG